MDGLPFGTVTFLFTDIEGSTRLLKQLRDRYGAALAEHQQILRGVFAEHDGHEIDTQGDSFFVAFRRATDAIATAVEGQRRLAQAPWPDGSELRVRMGIHTGEPAAAGEGYVGLGVHRAARICAAGHGGQVLVSQATRELLRDEPLPDVALRDLGEHQLKDLDEPERLYQLVAPGLDEEFAPLKTAGSSAFAGREAELAAAATDVLTSRWRRPGRRILTAGTVALALVVVGVVLIARGSRSTADAAVHSDSVAVISPSSGKLASAIPVGASPGGVTTGEGAVWVANTDDDTVSRIDPATKALRQTIQVGAGPEAVAAGGGAVWVTNGGDGTVSRIDPTTNRVVQRIHVGNGPVGVAYGEGAVWVANSVDGTLSRIDPASGGVHAQFPAVPGATGVAIGFGRVWVVSPSAGAVLALDPRSGNVLDRLSVGVDPSAVTAGAGAIWVANRGDGNVWRIDPGPPAHVATIVPVGRAPESVAAHDAGVWVADAGDGTLRRIDASTNRVAKIVHLTNRPHQLAVSDAGVFVAVRSAGLQHRGGTLRVVTDSIDFIDPALAYTAPSLAILSMTNDGLVGFRRVGGVEGIQLVPDLAVSVPTPTDEGKTYTFRLRDGIRYSTGRPVEAADFRAAIERVLEVGDQADPKNPPSPWRQYLAGVVGADRCVPGKPCDLSRGILTSDRARTVTFRLRETDPDFVAKLAEPFAVAVPAGTTSQPIGAKALPATGPYMVAAYRSPHSATLVRNPRFREWSADAQPAGYPDKLTWTFKDFPVDQPGQVRAVHAGSADVATDLAAPPMPKDVLATLATRYPSQLHFSPRAISQFFFLNTRVAPFNDERVRRAVNEAFDRGAFVRALGLGILPSCQILPPNFPGYRRTCPVGSGGTPAVDHARKLVRASGRAGMRVTVWVPTPRVQEGRLMVALLDRIGLRARLKALDPAVYFNRAADSRTRAQMGFYGWIADLSSAGAYLKSQFSCGAYLKADPANTNVSAFCDPSVDRRLARAGHIQALSPAEAPALWQRVERAILAQDPILPTYTKPDVSFVARQIGNFEYNPEFGVLYDQLWVK